MGFAVTLASESSSNEYLMKRIVRRVQSLNERAAELTSAAGQLPDRVAELRQAVTATSGELQNLKSGIEVNLTDLQVSREDDLSAAIAEVAAHAPVLAEAGFILDGLDVEVSPEARIIVQLVRYDDVETLHIQSLIQKYQQEKSVRAILSAVLKARAMVETIDIDGLDYHKLTVGIGPVPTIRLCWRDTSTEGQPFGQPSATSTSSRSSMQSAPQESFFGAPPAFRPMAETAPEPEHEEEVVEEVAQEPVVQELQPEPVEATHASHSSQSVATPPPLPAPVAPAPPPLPQHPVDPLAKFKVMPNLDRR